MSPLLVNLFLYLLRYLWPHSVLCPLSILGLTALSICVSPHIHLWRSWGQGGQSLLAYASTPELCTWQYWVTIYLCDGWMDSFYPPVQARYNLSGDVKDKHHQVIHTLCSSDQGFESHWLYCWPKLSAREMTTRYRRASQISEANLREGAFTAEFLLNLDKREYQGEWGRP